jgi:hypothetical protein
MSASINYYEGYKYQLADFYQIMLPEFKCEQTARNNYIEISGGLLTARAGYAWNGADWPAVDTRTIIRGSLIHDALYQLMDEGKLPLNCKERSDRKFVEICRIDGMSKYRAFWVYRAVKIFGRPDTGANKSPVKRAP